MKKSRNNKTTTAGVTHEPALLTYEEWLEQSRRNPVITNYRDTVFRMLYCDKRELLALYNAVNGTDYSNPDELQVTTLDSAIYMSMKNDVSFVLDMRLSLYEHQSTVNPNMPLRDLMYVAKVFEELIIHKDLYSKKQIQLPSPRFITFYNGIEKQPERREYRLSDAYSVRDEQPWLELIVIQLNINPGYNMELMKACPTLNQYMMFVDKIRTYGKTISLPEAVEKSVNECINEGILTEFLLKNKAKVVSMSIFEFDQELHNRTLYEEGLEDGERTGFAKGEKSGFAKGEESGFAKGEKTGLDKGRSLKLISLVCRKLQKNKTPEEIADALEEELDTIEKICKAAQAFAPEYDVEKIYKALN